MGLEHSPGTPSDLFGKKVNVLVVQMTYPEVLNYLVQNRSPQQAEEDVRDIGKNICAKLLDLWKPKSRSVLGAIKELMNMTWGGKIKTKVMERGTKKRPIQVGFIDHDCKLCKMEDEVLEAEGVHYCASVSGMLEMFLNILAKEGRVKLDYQSVVTRTVSSVASGDEKCVHLCTFYY